MLFLLVTTSKSKSFSAPLFSHHHNFLHNDFWLINLPIFSVLVCTFFQLPRKQEALPNLQWNVELVSIRMTKIARMTIGIYNISDNFSQHLHTHKHIWMAIHFIQTKRFIHDPLWLNIHLCVCTLHIGHLCSAEIAFPESNFDYNSTWFKSTHTHTLTKPVPNLCGKTLLVKIRPKNNNPEPLATFQIFKNICVVAPEFSELCGWNSKR